MPDNSEGFRLAGAFVSVSLEDHTERDLDKIRERIERLNGNIKITADTKDAEAKTEEFRAAAGKDVKVKVKAEADKASGALAGRELGDAASSAMGNASTSGGGFRGGSLMVAAVAAGITAGGPLLAGAAVLVGGAAVTALALAVEKNNPQIQRSWKSLTDTAEQTAREGFAGLVPVLSTVMNSWQADIAGMKPLFGDLANASIPFIKEMSSALEDATNVSLHGMLDVMQRSGPVVTALGGGVRTLATDFRQMLDGLNFQMAGQGLSLLFNDVGALLPMLGNVLNAIMPLGNVMLGAVGSVETLVSGLANNLAPALSRIGSLLSPLSGVIGDVGISMFAASKLAGVFGTSLKDIYSLGKGLTLTRTAEDVASLGTTFADSSKGVARFGGNLLSALTPVGEGVSAIGGLGTAAASAGGVALPLAAAGAAAFGGAMLLLAPHMSNLSYSLGQANADSTNMARGFQQGGQAAADAGAKMKSLQDHASKLTTEIAALKAKQEGYIGDGSQFITEEKNKQTQLDNTNTAITDTAKKLGPVGVAQLRYNNAVQDFGPKSAQAIRAQQQLRDQTNNYTPVVENLSSQVQNIKTPLQMMGIAFQGVGFDANGAAAGTKTFTGSLNMLFGNLVSSDQAAANFRVGLTQLNTQVAKGSHSLDINTAAGAQNRQAIDNSVTAIEQHLTALKKQGASQGTVSKAYDTDRNALIRQMTQLGFTKTAIEGVLDKLGLVPGAVGGVNDAMDKSASAQVAFKERWDSIASSMHPVLSTMQDINTYQATHPLVGLGSYSGGVTKASGGYISGAGSGTSDSIHAHLSNGEFVVRAKQVAKYRPLLEQINAPHFAAGGAVGSASLTAASGAATSMPAVAPAPSSLAQSTQAAQALQRILALMGVTETQDSTAVQTGTRQMLTETSARLAGVTALTQATAAVQKHNVITDTATAATRKQQSELNSGLVPALLTTTNTVNASFLPAQNSLQSEAGIQSVTAIRRLQDAQSPLQSAMTTTASNARTNFGLVANSVNTAVNQSGTSFNRMKTGLSQLGSAAANFQAQFRTQFGDLYPDADGPVGQIIAKPFNAGLIKAWNSVSKSFGLNKSASTIGYATGGPVHGPGNGTSDSVPALLSHGEYVVNAKSAAQHRGLLESINAPHFADGGLVSAMGGMINPAFKDVGPLADGVAGAYPGNAMAADGAQGAKNLVPLAEKAVAAQFQKMVASMGGAGGAGGGVTRWAPFILQALGLLHQPASLLGAVEHRMQQESGGNPTIVNTWDSNAMAGHPSVGLMQVIRGTFASNAGPFAGVGPFIEGVSVNPLANIYAGLHHALGSGRGLASVMLQPGGYDHGGTLLPGGIAMNSSSKPENIRSKSEEDALGLKLDTLIRLQEAANERPTTPVIGNLYASGTLDDVATRAARIVTQQLQGAFR